jgi:hypothetical protein
VLFDAFHVGDHRIGAVFVVFHFSQFEQFLRICQAGTDLVNAANNAFEDGAFLAQVLRPLRAVPDFRVFEFAADFF